MRGVGGGSEGGQPGGRGGGKEMGREVREFGDGGQVGMDGRVEGAGAEPAVTRGLTGGKRRL